MPHSFFFNPFATMKLSFIQAIAVVSFFLIHGQAIFGQNIVVSGLKNQNQLPMAELNRIFQDSEGYMWYGTKGGGLCRDDGYSIKVFRTDFKTPNLLESNWITSITEVNQNKIWFGTKRGLYLLDKNTCQIAKLADNEIQNWTIDAVFASSDGNVWVSTGRLLIRYNSDEKRLATYALNWNGQPRKIIQIYEDRAKNIWIVQWNGSIHRYNRDEDRFFPISWPFPGSPTAIMQDCRSNAYWVSTAGHGMVFYDSQKGDSLNAFSLQSASNPFSEFSHRHIMGFAMDSLQNQLFVITADNMYLYRIVNSNVLQFVDMQLHELPDKKMLNQIITDKSGNIWVAADFPSSYVLSFHQPIEQCRVDDMKYYTGFSVAPIAFVEHDGYFWFWQSRSGLYLYDSVNRHLTNVSHLPALLRRKKAPIVAKAPQKQGIFTMLDDTVLVRLTHLNGLVNNPETIVNLPSHERVHVLYHDDFGQLWIGTSTSLYRFDMQNKIMHCLYNDIGVVNDVITTSDRRTFVATEKHGLCQVLHSGLLHRFGVNKNFLNVAVSADDRIWAGTLHGDLFYLDAGSNRLIDVNELAGLNGDAVVDVEVDNSGLIWVLTNQRVVIYNPSLQSANVLFNSDAGIGFNSFMSLCKNNHGMVFVGGMGGFCWFPKLGYQPREKTMSMVKLTGINVNGQSRLLPFNQQSVLLQPFENSVELYFSTLDHIHADKIRFAFKYGNLADDWNYLPEGQNSVYLTGLTKGEHQLQVMATDKYGQWSQSVTNIKLQRLPAWYETNWAFGVYSLLIVGAFVGGLYYYLKWKRNRIINAQIQNSAADLQHLIHQLSEEILVPSPLEQVNLRVLLLNAKKVLQQQREMKLQVQQVTQPNSNDAILSASDEIFIQKALNFVESHLDVSAYSVEQLSKDMGMDRTGLYRKLVNIIGKTPTSFIRSIRLNRAAKLLEDGFSVAEVADRVGFGTSSYLSKCFFEEFGVKPSKYIASLKDKPKDE
jgi:ligand-binding sensor domain-containing protein/AraC-like DNA-binding protein